MEDADGATLGSTFTHPLARTARLTAAARARESQRDDRLFDDPWAAALAGRDGVAFLESLEAAGRPPGSAMENPYVAIRTRFFDDFLRAATGTVGVRQVVIVAAGLDTRAFRLVWPEGVRLFELDRADLLEAKNRLLARATGSPFTELRCDRRAIGVDLTCEPWDQALKLAGFDAAQPSVWLVEGLLAYLDEAGARDVLGRSAASAAPGSLLGADAVSRTSLTSPRTRGTLELLEREQVPWRFGTDDPEAFFSASAWAATVYQPGDPGANFGRWPVPESGRDRSELPQSFLITATKG